MRARASYTDRARPGAVGENSKIGYPVTEATSPNFRRVLSCFWRNADITCIVVRLSALLGKCELVLSSFSSSQSWSCSACASLPPPCSHCAIFCISAKLVEIAVAVSSQNSKFAFASQSIEGFLCVLLSISSHRRLAFAVKLSGGLRHC